MSGASTATRLRVLVVDDEDAIRRCVVRALPECAVQSAVSGHEAVALLTAGARFDVILSDMRMPGMDGLELFAIIARDFPEMAGRVVLCSAFTQELAAYPAATPAPKHTLDKPFSMAELKGMIARVAAGLGST